MVRLYVPVGKHLVLMVRLHVPVGKLVGLYQQDFQYNKQPFSKIVLKIEGLLGYEK